MVNNYCINRINSNNAQMFDTVVASDAIKPLFIQQCDTKDAIILSNTSLETLI